MEIWKKAFERKALITYLTAFDPDRGKSLEYFKACANGGADILEIGHPFSDPIADGPIISAAMTRALKNKVSVAQMLSLTEDVRKFFSGPLVYFTYFNPLFNFGLEDFLSRYRDLNGNSMLIVDLPYEEAERTDEVLAKYGISRISLLAPTTDQERQKRIADISSNFIYMISYSGVTGSKEINSLEISKRIDYLRNLRPDLPICCGFGIKSPAEIEALRPYADGFVVGSSLVKMCAEGASPDQLRDFVHSLKSASNE